MTAEIFCTFAEYLQKTAGALEVKAKETRTGLLSDHMPSSCPFSNPMDTK